MLGHVEDDYGSGCLQRLGVIDHVLAERMGEPVEEASGLPGAIGGAVDPDARLRLRDQVIATLLDVVAWRSVQVEGHIRLVEARSLGQDERALKRKLLPHFVPEREWALYEVDQIINDRGIPMDRKFVESAIRLSDRRKEELTTEMRDLTGLANPGSTQQLLPWLKDRGYWFDDMQKDTVRKSLAEGDDLLTQEAVDCLKLRQQQARTSVRKYNAVRKALARDDRLRFCLQFGGASRTNRWAGRRFQPQNLPSTPAVFEDSENLLGMVTECIRDSDYDGLSLFMREPMDALSGLVRSSVKAVSDDTTLVVCDLSSIESCVIGWLARCPRLIGVFLEGKDAYKDFATELYSTPYDGVTKLQRKMAKPATLGAGFRLGGGSMIDGKKTGLWGYAEKMGIDMTQEEAKENVAIFRRVYKEIPQFWFDLEAAIMHTLKTGERTSVGYVSFFKKAEYLIAKLPSGRCIYYHKPMVRPTKIKFPSGDTAIKDQISYMGKQQNGNAWVRVQSHGGKFTENLVQAVARDVLALGMRRAHKAGFNLVMHVHDELVCEQRIGDNQFNLESLRAEMIRPIKWAPGLPLNAAGHEAPLYRK